MIRRLYQMSVVIGAIEYEQANLTYNGVKHLLDILDTLESELGVHFKATINPYYTDVEEVSEDA